MALLLPLRFQEKLSAKKTKRLRWIFLRCIFLFRPSFTRFKNIFFTVFGQKNVRRFFSPHFWLKFTTTSPIDTWRWSLQKKQVSQKNVPFLWLEVFYIEKKLAPYCTASADICKPTNRSKKFRNFSSETQILLRTTLLEVNLLFYCYIHSRQQSNRHLHLSFCFEHKKCGIFVWKIDNKNDH